jgi:flagellar motor switch protein FliG
MRVADLSDTLDAPAETPRTAPAMKGESAAAILMLLLDEGDAAAILKHLDPDEIKALGKAMYAAAQASEREIDTALCLFHRRSSTLTRFALGVEPRVRSVMVQALGNVRADSILADIAPQAGGTVLDLLRWMERPAIARLLAQEHPQVGALVLSVLTPEVAADVLQELDDLMQADLVLRAAKLGMVPASALTDLGHILAQYGDIKNVAAPVRLGGKSEVAKIFNKMKKPSGDRILKSLKKSNRQIGEQIEEEMFIFDNLLALSDQTLGIVLRSVDASMLGLALRGADEAQIDKMLGTMSARAAMSVRDDMADRGPVRREEVDEAQRAIVAIARGLAADGTILLGGGGDDYV